MKYYKFKLENTETFLELDNEYYCLRAIFQKNKKLYNTYLYIANEEFVLPEGCLFDSLENFHEFNEKEFKNPLEKIKRSL